jgi:hypothetical protein
LLGSGWGGALAEAPAAISAAANIAEPSVNACWRAGVLGQNCCGHGRGS